MKHLGEFGAMQQDSISTFRPNRLPIRLHSKTQFQKSAKKAREVIDQFDAVLTKYPIAKDLSTLLSIHEAIDSLESQHIKANAEDVLIDKLLGEKVTERKPILDYLKGFSRASKQIVKHPLSHPFFFDVHRSIKGLLKNEHRYRHLQNWIGPEGGPAEKAYFFPPAPATVLSYMSNLIKYWNRKEKDPFVQLAVIFAQLLIIHPFMDGNGRIARLLVPLFLCQKGEISKPVFFLSRYFKRHRLAYFQNLFSITSENRWDLWIQFFLKGIHEQGLKDLKNLKRIIALYTALHNQLSMQWPPKKAKQILRFLFQHPIFSLEMCSPQFGRTQKEIDHTINCLRKKKILKPIRRRGKSFFAFTELLIKKTSKELAQLSRPTSFKRDKKL